MVKSITGRKDQKTFADSLKRVLYKPTWPTTIDKPMAKEKLGTDYDTEWSRKKPVRVLRAMLIDNVVKPSAYMLARPKVSGAEYLSTIDTPVIFASNHASHLDTSVIIASLPLKFRHHIAVAAASDYFFDTKLKAFIWAFAFASIPIERNKVNRKSSDLAVELIRDGWSLLIFPEGGRTPDGWGQEFKSGTAYLAQKTMVPIVPIHISGTRKVMAKGSRRVAPGKTEIRFGNPIQPIPVSEQENESSRSSAAAENRNIRLLTTTLEENVAQLFDEANNDWWSSLRQDRSEQVANLRGPEVASWRRNWELPEANQKKQNSIAFDTDKLKSLSWWENEYAKKQIDKITLRLKALKRKI
ncbi:MAG: 1-acyl-sn-glycerol-3-phosphate acyltransferase [Firmicutes bacterium]|nr:1-acyl-sn-glycerol-3-phosphate acyltransferase [Bacillota bacterium]